MSSFPPPQRPQELLRRAGLRAKKSWGQNFLCDPTVLQSITEAIAPSPRGPIVELGAGLGALTYHLAVAGAPILAIERDRDLAPILQRYLSWASHFEVRQANVLRLDYGALAHELGGPLTVVGNLPYQLSGRILVALADAAVAVRRAVLMVQREVAERLVAPPGGRTYGLLSVLVQRAFTPHIVRLVAPSCFHPPPRVESAVVSLLGQDEQRDPADERAMVAVARAAFSGRRKNLRNALRGGLHADAASIDGVLQQAQIAGTVRAETLSCAAFAHLGRCVAAAGLLPGTAP